MFEMSILNLETKKSFTKTFYDEYSLKKFQNKCKYSKKLLITGVMKFY